MQTVTDLAKRAESIEEDAGLKVLRAYRDHRWTTTALKIRSVGFSSIIWGDTEEGYDHWENLNKEL